MATGAFARGSAWWRGRSARERMLMIAMVAALALYVVVVGVAQPMRLARQDTLADVARHDAALARLAAQPLDGPPVAPDGRSVAAVLTASAVDYDLTIRRIEAQDQGARIEIDDAGFAEVVLWIEELERDHGLRVDAVEMERRPGPGVVGVRMTVTR